MLSKIKHFALGIAVGAFYFLFAVMEAQIHQNFYTQYSIFNVAVDILILLVFLPGFIFIYLRGKIKTNFFWVLGGMLLGLPAIAIAIYYSAGSHYPVKEEVIAKLEQYRKKQGHYPQNLDTIGIKVEEQSTRYIPSSDASSFSLCFVYPMMHEGSEIILTKPVPKRIVTHDRYPIDAFECYDSQVGKWKSIDYVRRK